MFSFASKMLNTLIGSEDDHGQPPPQQQQQQQQQQHHQPHHHQPPPQQQHQQQRGPAMAFGPPPPHRLSGPSPPRLVPAQSAALIRPQREPEPPAGAEIPQVDLSHLSDEERVMIQSVMAKAQQLDTSPPQRKETESRIQHREPAQRREMEFGPKPCPICHTREVNVGMSRECVDCHNLTCSSCGSLVASPETKKAEWTCNACQKRTKFSSPMRWQHQQQLSMKNLSQQQQSWEVQKRGMDMRSEAQQRIDSDREYTGPKPQANGISRVPSPNGKLPSSTPTSPPPISSPPSGQKAVPYTGMGSKYRSGSGVGLQRGLSGRRDDSNGSEDEEDDDEEESEEHDEEDDKDMADSEDEQEDGPVTTAKSLMPSGQPQPSSLVPLFDHSPGEVYTIPEEEEGAASPTSGDGVSSLRQQRLVGDILERGKSTEVIKDGQGENMYTDNLHRCGVLSQSEMALRNGMTGLDIDRTRIQLVESGSEHGGSHFIHSEIKAQQHKHQQQQQQLQQQQLHHHQQQQQQQQQREREQLTHHQSFQEQQKLENEHKAQSQQHIYQESLLHDSKTQLQSHDLQDQNPQQLLLQQQLQQQQLHQQKLHLQKLMQQSQDKMQQMPMMSQQQNSFQNQKSKPKFFELQDFGTVNPTLQKTSHTQHQQPMFQAQNQIGPHQQQQQQQHQQQQQQQQAAVPTSKQSTGTISGMLADFSRALGLGGTSPRPSPSEENPVLDHKQQQQQHQNVYNQELQHLNQQSLFKQQHQDQLQQQNLQNLQNLQLQQAQDLQSSQQMQNKRNEQLQQQMLIQEPQFYQQQLQQQQQQQTSSLMTGASLMNERQSMIPQHMTPQKQLMYQQQMQLQHQAQHLKKIRRSLPHSSGGAIEQTANQVQLQQQQLQQQQQQLQQQQQQLQQQQLQHQQQQQIQHQQQLQQQQIQQHQQMQQHQQLQFRHLAQRKEPVTSQAMLLSQAVSSQVPSSQPLQHTYMGALPMTTQMVGMMAGQPFSAASLLAGQNMCLVSGPATGSSSFMQQMPPGMHMDTPQSTPVGTPRGPRDTGGDSSDTLSETDSQKSLRMRRKLPPIPADQEAAPLPSLKKRDRNKSKTTQDKFRTFAALRQTSLDGLLPRAPNLLLARPSASETNLRKIALGVDPVPRPGSALGLLQASSVVSSSGLRSTGPVMGASSYSAGAGTGIRSPPLSDIASCLPPDLRHLLGSTSLSDNFPYSKKLPNYMKSLKDQLRDEIKISVSDRRHLSSISDKEREAQLRRERDKFESLRDPLKSLDVQRKLASPVMGRSRKLRGHRRQLSDPKIHPQFSPIKEDSDFESEYDRGYLNYSHPSLKPPYKAYEYESINDMGRRAEWDPSQSYLASSYAAAGGALRETAINSVLDEDRYFTSSRYGLRRSSDGHSGLDSRRRHDTHKHRKPRSWHPSPYGSDDDDDQLTREEKKAKIKAEIARRRQQIEENARLHEELLRLARLRESAELGFTPHSGTELGHHGGGYGTSSVLKSIDELLMSGSSGSGLHLDYRGHTPLRTEEDRSMDRIASTFRTDDYTAGVYERLSDFSPLMDFTPHAMPLLPDMPTRSRKLLEDLGSSPITESVLAPPQKSKYGSRLYAK